jgi:hypothetical protein
MESLAGFPSASRKQITLSLVEQAADATHGHQAKANGDDSNLLSRQYLPTSEMLDYRLH